MMRDMTGQHDHHVKAYWVWRLSLLVDGLIVRVRMVP